MTDTSKFGTYTIERVGGQVNCLLPSGETAGEKWLKTELNGLTKQIYQSIYSFSALDLTSIRQMQAKELSNVLFSVGLTGATSIYEIEKQLDKKIGEIGRATCR